MSLQRFYDVDSKSYLYQAVWSTSLPTHFAVSAPASATAGTALNLTVTPLDSFSQTVTGYSGSARFTGTDKAAVLPAESMLSDGEDEALPLGRTAKRFWAGLVPSQRRSKRRCRTCWTSARRSWSKPSVSRI